MISVITPTYSEAAVIVETLRRAAALRTAGEDFEFVVVIPDLPVCATPRLAA